MLREGSEDIKLAAIQRALEERERQLPRPKLAPGTELIGEYEGSGFKEPQYIARRADGQVLQLPHLLYIVAEASDGTRDLREIGAVLQEELHRSITLDNVQYLVEEKLRPLGILVDEQGNAAELPKHQPLLALKFRQAVIPPAVVNVAARLFKPLFFPLVIGAVLAWVATLDVWLFFHHGVAGGVRELLYQPGLLVAMLGLLALSAVFHECGHATACRYGGATPGAMGAGLYIVWPAFYTDVTDAYRLNRVGRLRTDLGGVYFNLVFVLAVAGVYFWTGFEPLLALIAIQHIEILHQFVPWIRLDGYYVVSDLTGVPDVMSRVKPTLLSLVPGRAVDPRVAQLKPWVRGVVAVYVLTVVPILAGFAVLMIMAAPHVLATAVSSGKMEVRHIASAVGHRDVFDAFVGGVQLIALALPPLGLVVTLLRLVRTAARHALRPFAGRPKLRTAAAVAVCTAAVLTGMNWWSNGSFNPIARGDRGTIQSAARAMTLRRKPHEPAPGGSRPEPVRAPSTTDTQTQTVGDRGATTQTTSSTETAVGTRTQARTTSTRGSTTGPAAPPPPEPTVPEVTVTTPDTTTASTPTATTPPTTTTTP